MAKRHLVIVESPAKARTIVKILGSKFEVTSSMGHLRDLPASKLGVDVDNNFEPHYIVIQKRRKFAKQLQEMARGRSEIYLAPDPDREGEAISWHLAQLLKEDDEKQAIKRVKLAEKQAKLAAKRAERDAARAKDGKPRKASKKKRVKKIKPPVERKIFRVTFGEITASAILAAIKRPMEIDLKKVDAQQARRILDRLVGYSLSPLLWKKVGRGLSAGRVQSVALRLVVDREKAIEAFNPQEYWTIEAELRKEDGQTFKAQLDRIADKKTEIKNEAQARKISEDLKSRSCVVESVEKKEQRRYPKAPFTTSTLQQEAFNKLGYQSGRTMRIAQQLYEGMEIGEEAPAGLITYMRTDSVRIANEAMKALHEFIPEKFGKEYLPQTPRTYKSKKRAQEAHEAIRPTGVTRTPESIKEHLSPEQFALYQLIWQRFVASQMADAVDRVVAVRIACAPAAGATDAKPFTLKANGRTNIFPGWTQAYQAAEDDEKDNEGALPEGLLPELSKDDALSLVSTTPSQHFTKPPRRFTDASLVKTLEEEGIGRPSTYAPTIQTIVARDYVRRQGGSLVPTKLGRIVTELLIESFPEVLDPKFTAAMEDELDRIEEGEMEWTSVVRNFYTPFSKRVAVAQEEMREVKREAIPTDYKCEKCGKPMVIKWGRYGQFLSCSDYPECKNAKPVPTGVKCPEEGCNGDLVERKARGRHFYGCSNYPTCRHTTQRLPKSEEGAPDAGGNGESSVPESSEKSEKPEETQPPEASQPPKDSEGS